jgi:inner membrane transporter RhtA
MRTDIVSGTAQPARRPRAERVPPHVYFVGSAIFHYLGPAFAVLLFAHVAPLGVAWLRIVSAAVIFAAWRRPWRAWRTFGTRERQLVVALGVVLAVMNSVFYEAIARLPLASVGAIEFLGPIALAALGVRSRRNLAAVMAAVGGVALLSHVRLEGEPVGLLLAFANCALFALYIMLGHQAAAAGAASGIDRLAAAMVVAALVAFPIGIAQALPALGDPVLLGAAVGVGICSSVIPYVCDQLAMARLPRASFALLLSLLPATAALIGIVVLRQVPSPTEMAGIGFVAIGVALHRPRSGDVD